MPAIEIFSKSELLEIAEVSSATARRVRPGMGSCGRNILESAAR